MNKIEIVRHMQDYIENNIKEKISLTDLAKDTFYSPWYCFRIFNEVLKITPGDYIRRLKLSLSALMLRDQKKKIIDVAYEYGYNSVDGYQRAFYKEFGTNPYNYSVNPTPICLFYPYKIYERKEERNMEKQNVKSIFMTIIKKPARKVIIKRGIKADEYMSYCQEVGCDIWGILTSMKSLDNEPVCLWLPKKYVKPNTSTYVQGVEVALNDNTVIPEGFDVIELPSSDYLLFQTEPFEESDFEEAIMGLWEAIKKYNPEPLGYKWDEENPRIQLEPIGSRGYIELVPICKK